MSSMRFYHTRAISRLKAQKYQHKTGSVGQDPICLNEIKVLVLVYILHLHILNGMLSTSSTRDIPSVQLPRI